MPLALAVLAFLRRGAFVRAWVGQASDGVASTVRGRFHFSVGLVAGPRLGPRIASGFMHTHASPRGSSFHCAAGLSRLVHEAISV